MALREDQIEFKNAVRDISSYAVKLKNPIDRVRCCEWVRKLATMPSDGFDSSKKRNDYIQFLRIVVKSGLLHGIFLKNPPPGEIPPLAEALGTLVTKNIEKMPEVGPVAPYVCHKSPDGRSYLSIKRLADEGVICYMAVAPEGF